MSSTDGPDRPHLHKNLIAEPCPTLGLSPDFDDGAAAKACEGCDERVHNLSALSQDEAAELLTQQDGICVHYEVSPSGGPHFRTPPTRLKPALVGGITMALAMVAGCGKESSGNGGGIEAESIDVSSEAVQTSGTTPEPNETDASKPVGDIDPKTKPKHKVGRISRPRRPTNTAAKATANEADCEDEPTQP